MYLPRYLHHCHQQGTWCITPSPCKERLRYHLNDTFLADVFTSEPSPLSLAEHVVHTPMTEEKSDLAVPHHMSAMSRVNTMAICAAVAHHVTPCRETSPFDATLGRYCQTTDNDKKTLSLLGPEQKGHTPVYDPGSVYGRVTEHHLDDLSVTLNAQTERVGDTITNIIGKANDKAALAEMETLVSAARESAKQVAHFLMMEPPTHFDRMVSKHK